MKVFLDTNVIIDFFLGRENKLQAGIILQLGLDRTVDLFLSDLTFVNFFYICRKAATAEQRFQFMSFLRSFISVLPIGQECVDKAIAMQAKDFEDSIQYLSASSADMDVIVTSNKADFKQFDMKIYTPAEFLKLMNVE